MTGEAFRMKPTFTFSGGPSDGDTINMDADTYWVEVPDKHHPETKHSYARVGATDLVYQGTTDTALKDQKKLDTTDTQE